MAFFENLNTEGLENLVPFIEYFPYTLFALPEPEDSGLLGGRLKEWETENHVNIANLLDPYIDKEKKTRNEGIFFNLSKMSRGKPFFSFFPQVSAIKRPRSPEVEKETIARMVYKIKNMKYEADKKNMRLIKPKKHRKKWICRNF